MWRKCMAGSMLMMWEINNKTITMLTGLTSDWTHYRLWNYEAPMMLDQNIQATSYTIRDHLQRRWNYFHTRTMSLNINVTLEQWRTPQDDISARLNCVLITVSFVVSLRNIESFTGISYTYVYIYMWMHVAGKMWGIEKQATSYTSVWLPSSPNYWA